MPWVPHRLTAPCFSVSTARVVGCRTVGLSSGNFTPCSLNGGTFRAGAGLIELELVDDDSELISQVSEPATQNSSTLLALAAEEANQDEPSSFVESDISEYSDSLLDSQGEESSPHWRLSVRCPVAAPECHPRAPSPTVE